MSERICEEPVAGGRTVALYKGDLTAEVVDASVNAANSFLAHGGGVAGAIVRRGGDIIQEESNRLVEEKGPVLVGEAAITGPGRLPCKAVIHAVGPQWGEGDEDEKLRRAIRSSLDLATERKFASVAFPAISSGIFGFPKDRCARIFWRTTLDWLAAHPDATIREVRFTLIDDPTVQHFRKAWEELRGGKA